MVSVPASSREENGGRGVEDGLKDEVKDGLKVVVVAAAVEP